MEHVRNMEIVGTELIERNFKDQCNEHCVGIKTRNTYGTHRNGRHSWGQVTEQRHFSNTLETL